jgi:hypothetical protein
MTASVARMAELAGDPDLWPGGTPLTPEEHAALMGGTAARLLR